MLSEKTKSVITDLNNLIDTCLEEELHYKASTDSWSILECVEHICLVNGNVSKILQTPPPSSHENKLSEIHSEGKINHLLVTKRDTKRSAPSFVVPKGIFKTATEAKQVIENDTKRILATLETVDISKETHTVPHPALGEMTKTDWVHFLISHTKRHLFQIEDIKMNFRNRLQTSQP